MEYFPLEFRSHVSLRSFKDQNFHRATWMKTSPALCPCLLPAGKYIVTCKWRLLSAKEKVCEEKGLTFKMFEVLKKIGCICRLKVESLLSGENVSSRCGRSGVQEVRDEELDRQTLG